MKRKGKNKASSTKPIVDAIKRAESSFRDVHPNWVIPARALEEMDARKDYKALGFNSMHAFLRKYMAPNRVRWATMIINCYRIGRDIFKITDEEMSLIPYRRIHSVSAVVEDDPEYWLRLAKETRLTRDELDLKVGIVRGRYKENTFVLQGCFKLVKVDSPPKNMKGEGRLKQAADLYWHEGDHYVRFK
jgi:hypothetical protein